MGMFKLSPGSGVWGSGFRVQGLGFRLQGLGGSEFLAFVFRGCRLAQENVQFLRTSSAFLMKCVSGCD